MRSLAAIVLLLAVVVCGCASAMPPAGDPAASDVDYSCRSDADCAIKDVGNCCGYYPACVNKNSPTFPERVLAECAKTGQASVCGWPVIKGCSCHEGRCARSADGGAEVR